MSVAGCDVNVATVLAVSGGGFVLAVVPALRLAGEMARDVDRSDGIRTRLRRYRIYAVAITAVAILATTAVNLLLYPTGCTP